MGIRLKAPTLADIEKIRLSRNEMIAAYRTPYLLTKEMQEQFYHDHICNRSSNSRWWSVYKWNGFIGLVGLTDIEWENAMAQVSLHIMPEVRGKGYGEQALSLLLDEGFGNMGLQTIYGECYECNPGLGFWGRMVMKHDGYQTTLPRRKRWQGKLYDAMYFAFWR